MFAIIDLETTGGNHNSERIIEIGIVLHDGKNKTGEYTTLINPEKEIGGFISTFTGITNSMVRTAPKFEDVAETLLELLEGKIFVAHNAKFDYNFIKSEFRRLNIPFTQKNICTVQLSRKIFPHIKSHSLGNLCRDLGLPVDNRHRAFGDAAATALLLEKLIEADKNNLLKEMLDDDGTKLYLPKNLNKNALQILPEEVGVLYFHDKDGNVLFIDKSKNIREYIHHYFSKKTSDKQKLQLHEAIYDISFLLTGNELIAGLTESQEIRKLHPIFNKPSSNFTYKFGLFSETDMYGFQKLMVKMLEEDENPLLKFSSKFKAEKMLHSILTSFKLEPTFKKIDNALQYNSRLHNVLSRYVYPYKNCFIIDVGRGGSERSVIQIENNEYKGHGFFEPAYINDPNELKDIIKPQQEYTECKKLIQQYIRKYEKHIEVIPY